jgi:D-alanyl-lipoteichoic acid acyltransferase DltB (MBOAT superfamily)
MSGLLVAGGVSDADRVLNDRHDYRVVGIVLLLLAIYFYCFTHVDLYFGLPSPQSVAESAGIFATHVFDSDHNVSSFVTIERTSLLASNDSERLGYLLILVAAFLCAYFLPLRFKQPSLVFWSTLAIGILYGTRACLLLLCTHTILYLLFHPRRNLIFAALPGILFWLAMSSDQRWGIDPFTGWVVMPLVSMLAYLLLAWPLLQRERTGALLRAAAAQSAIIVLFAGAVYNGMAADNEWLLPLGLLLFFFQWERIILYHIDFKDGAVPARLGYLQYLAVFISPGGIPNWVDRVCIGQGYAYLNKTFLCRDKNAIVMAGAHILLLALGYLVAGDWLRHAVVALFESAGIPVYGGNTQNLIGHYMKGEQISTVSVLSATMLNLFQWFIFFAAVGHFKVGVWRLCGYDVAPSFDKPWLATNLVAFWGRFTYHYREFLVRAFYYPVFFRYFRRHRKTRIVVATLASAGLGNMVWGHMVEINFYRGMQPEALAYVAGHWPYYLLLGGGIAITELYLLKHKRKRKPWSRDRWLLTDLLAAYCTLQFFALIHVFNRTTEGSTVWDQCKLFLIAFGIHL